MLLLADSVYMHFRPDVPAEMLPIQLKSPIVTIIVMLPAILNMYLHRSNQRVMTN